MKGVRALIVISAGFSEADAKGKQLQQELVRKVRGHGMRMVGPNCMGLLNTDSAVRLNASFSPVFPPAGTLAMSSQSGALGLAVLALGAENVIWVSPLSSASATKRTFRATICSNTGRPRISRESSCSTWNRLGTRAASPGRSTSVSRSKPIVAVKAGRSARRPACGGFTHGRTSGERCCSGSAL